MFVVDAEQQLPQPAVVTAEATAAAPTTETSTVSLAQAVVVEKSKNEIFYIQLLSSKRLTLKLPHENCMFLNNQNYKHRSKCSGTCV